MRGSPVIRFSPLHSLDTQAEFVWLLGTSRSVAPSVRRELLATIPESLPIALLAAASTLGVALCAVVVTHSYWATAWLIAEVLIVCSRLFLLLG
ncbi:MAG: hypothetical protein ACK4TD_01615 [Ectopseudomonas guguanensis]|uniref:hypothetical protein n=1 Tax=Ectopseudomonas guguanensis TaxID=1198456 RepID=UPI00391B3DF7